MRVAPPALQVAVTSEGPAAQKAKEAILSSGKKVQARAGGGSRHCVDWGSRACAVVARPAQSSEACGGGLCCPCHAMPCRLMLCCAVCFAAGDL